MNLAELLAAYDAHAEIARVLYETHPERAKQAMVLEERAKRCGCLLLAVWQSPAGLWFYHPAYRLAPALNASESSEDGRRANTTDGVNHWRAYAGFFDDMRSWAEQDAHLDLVCAHSRHRIAFAELIDSADRGRERRLRGLGPLRRVV
jgi:hypothetical protein